MCSHFRSPPGKITHSTTYITHYGVRVGSRVDRRFKCNSVTGSFPAVYGIISVGLNVVFRSYDAVGIDFTDPTRELFVLQQDGPQCPLCANLYHV